MSGNSMRAEMFKNIFEIAVEFGLGDEFLLNFIDLAEKRLRFLVERAARAELAETLKSDWFAVVGFFRAMSPRFGFEPAAFPEIGGLRNTDGIAKARGHYGAWLTEESPNAMECWSGIIQECSGKAVVFSSPDESSLEFDME